MLVALTLAIALLNDPWHPDHILTEQVRTAHFVIRFRPCSRAEASVDRVMVKAEEYRNRILDRLEFPQFSEKITLYLYDDVQELQKITRTSSAGVSVTRTTHVPHDNDQTLFHELVHVVAEFLPEKGNEPRNMFFAEGIANAVIEFVHGVHVHSAAAFEMRRDKLPSLEDMHCAPDFYGWLQQNPGVNGYDIAGSYFLHLFETYGAKKTRRYYKGASPTAAFGKSLQQIETSWRAKLAKVTLRPGVEQLLYERAGQPARFTTYVESDDLLTPELLGPVSAWSSLMNVEGIGNNFGSFAKESSSWLVDGPTTSGDWAECVLGETRFGDALVRCRAEPEGRLFGVKVAIGKKCQALLGTARKLTRK